MHYFTAIICQQEYRTHNLITPKLTQEWYRGLKDKKKIYSLNWKEDIWKFFSQNLFFPLSLTLIPLAQVCPTELLCSLLWTLRHCDDGLFLYGQRARTEEKNQQHIYTFSHKSSARHLVVQSLNRTHFQKLHPDACSCTVCEPWVWFKPFLQTGEYENMHEGRLNIFNQIKNIPMVFWCWWRLETIFSL